MNNPLLEPIHGITLQDLGAISAKMASGIKLEQICSVMGIEPAIFDEASELWIARMQEDPTYEVTTLYGKYFGEADQHPKLSNLQVEMTEDGQENLEKMKTDRYFYEEMNAARQAAYEYGLDGAQWIQDNYGINLGDFQSVVVNWMPKIQSEEYEKLMEYTKYNEEKQKEYAAKFAQEQGGNIADDIEF